MSEPLESPPDRVMYAIYEGSPIHAHKCKSCDGKGKHGRGMKKSPCTRCNEIGYTGIFKKYQHHFDYRKGTYSAVIVYAWRYSHGLNIFTGLPYAQSR